MIRMDWIKGQMITPTLQDEIRVNCPECSDDKFHMYCNLGKRVYICHKCGAKGKIVDDTTVAPDVIAYDSVKAAFNKSFPKKYETKDYSVKVEVVKERRTLPICHPIESQYDTKAWEYLRKRGLSFKQISEFYVGTGGESIILPIRNKRTNDLDYYVERNIGSKGPRYKNAPWSKRGTLYYAYPENDYEDFGKLNAVIVEGIFDAMAIARLGYIGISILGKTATYEQLARLKGGNYIVMLDKDAFKDGVIMTMALGHMANKTCVLSILPEKDPADMILSDRRGLMEVIKDGIKQFKKPQL